MGKIELLDCTLRDGAYVVNGDFGETTIRGVIRNLTEAHVEYIECGWLKDGAHVPGSTYYHIPGDACCYMPDGHVCAKYVAMIDWDRYNLESLPMCDNRSISTIRMVFPHGKQKDALSLASKITEKGYCVTCGIHIAPRAKMMEWKYCYGARPIKFILDKRRAVDVDDVFDMACARSWLDMVDVESEI